MLINKRRDENMGNRKFMKYLSTIMLVVFTVMPVMDWASASVGNQPKQYVEFTVEDEMEVQVGSDAMLAANRSAANPVAIKVAIGESTEMETDFSVNLVSVSTGDIFTATGEHASVTLPQGEYYASFSRLPDGTVDESSGGAKTVTVSADTSELLFKLNAGFGQAKKVTLTGLVGPSSAAGIEEYTEFARGQMTYLIEKQVDDNYQYATTVTAGSGETAFTTLNNGTYRVSVDSMPDNYQLAETALSSVDKSTAYQVFFYMYDTTTNEVLDVDFTVKVAANNSFIGNAVIKVVSEDGSRTSMNVTNDHGEVSMTVKAGNNTVTVYHPLLANPVTTKTINVTGPTMPIVLEGGTAPSIVPSLNIDNTAGSEYKGIIRNAQSGEIVMGIFIRAGELSSIWGLPVGTYSYTELNGFVSDVFEIVDTSTPVNLTFGRNPNETVTSRVVIVGVSDVSDETVTDFGEFTVEFKTSADATSALETLTCTGASTKTTIPTGAGVLVMKDAPAGYSVAQEVVMVDNTAGALLANFTLTPEGTETYPLDFGVVNGSFDIVTGANFKLVGDSGYTATFTSNNDGQILEAVPLGTYTVSYLGGGQVNGVDIGASQMASITYTHTVSSVPTLLQLEPIESTSNITFIARDTDGNVVQGVTFNLTGVAPVGYSDSHTTGVDGTVLTQLVSGNYNLQVQYVPAEYTVPDDKTVSVTKGEDTEIEILLSSEAVHNLAVDVKNEAGESLNPVIFSVYDTAGNLVGTLQSGGTNTLSLPQASYVLRCDRAPEGYITPGDKTIELNSSTTVRYELPVVSGSEQPSTCILTVSAVDENGYAINGATITATDTSDSSNVVTGITSGGSGANLRVKAGTYSLTGASVSGYSTPPAKTVTVSGVQSTSLIYTTEQSTGQIPVRLLIKDSDDKGIEGVKVAFSKISDARNANYVVGTSNPTGLVSVMLDEGNYNVSLVTLPSGVAKTAAIPASIEVEQTETYIDMGSVNFTNFSADNTVSQAVADTYTNKYTVSLKDDSHRPVVGANLQVRNAGSGEKYVYTVTTGSDGRAVIPVPQAVGTEGYDYKVKIASAPADFTPGGQYTLASTDVNNVWLLTGSGATLKGGVYVNETLSVSTKGTLAVSAYYGDNLMAGVNFTVTDPTTNTTNSYTTSTSTTEVSLEAGTYRLNITSVPAGYSLSNSSATDVEITAGGKANVKVYLSSANTVNKGKITITAAFNGQLMSNIGFALQDVNGNALSSGVTNASGVLVFADLAPGTYKLVNISVPAGYSLLNNMNVSVTANTNTPVVASLQLKDGEEEIQNKDGYGSLYLTVKDTLGNPVTDAEFTLYDSEEETLTGYTDNVGKLVFKELPVGLYSLVQTSAGSGKTMLLERKSITISSGLTNSVELTTSSKKGYTVLATVFEDLNANGVYESNTDELYRGATISLLDEDDNILISKKTNGNGEVEFKYVPEGSYVMKVTKIKGYNFIGKKYGTIRDSSMLSTKGTYDLDVEEDSEDILFGIVSSDLEINPIMGSNSGTDNTSRYPTLDGEEGINDNQFLIDYDTTDDMNGAAIDESGSGGGNILSNLPKTGDNGYAYVSHLFMFCGFVMACVMRYKFREA